MNVRLQRRAATIKQGEDTMSDKRPVVVYGVSGYTGRLVCEYLREYNVPFIAAGRDKARVQAVVDKIPASNPLIMRWSRSSTASRH
jgi:hypothetical protein